MRCSLPLPRAACAGAEVDAFHPAPKGGCQIARRPAYAAAKIQHAGGCIELSRAVSIDYKTSVTCHGKKSIKIAAGDYGNVCLAFLAKARRHRSGAFRVLGRTGCVCCQFFTEVISAVTLCKISLT